MRRSPASLPIAVAGLLLAPLPAHAASQVRMFNAATEPGRVSLSVVVRGRDVQIGSAGYARQSARTTIPTGWGFWRLRVGGRIVASGEAPFRTNRRYTIVALSRGGGRYGGSVLRDATSAGPTEARIRVMHAAPELGSPDIATAGQTLARRLNFGRTTVYGSVAPGRRATQALRPGTREAVLSQALPLGAGSATTVVVVGTVGRPVRAIRLDDLAAAGAASASATAITAASGDYTVGPGDTFWSIAAQRVGSQAPGDAISAEVTRLWDRNEAPLGLASPDVLAPGQPLSLG